MSDDSAGAAPTQETNPERTTPRRKRVPLIAAIAGGAVLLVGGTGATYAVLAAQHAPEHYVQSFLQELVDGHASLALDYVSDVPEMSPLLADKVYSAATDRISAFTVTGTAVEGDHATVSATITQGATESDRSFTLTRVGRDAVFDIWSIDGGQLPTFRIAFPRPDSVNLTANGVAIDKFPVEVPALPGTYAFAANGTTEQFDVAPAAGTVSFAKADTKVKVPLSVILTEQGATAAQSAVAAHMAACFAQTVLAPTGGCGYSVIDEDPPSLSNQRWTLLTPPTFTFGAWAGTGADGGWPLIPGAGGSLRWDADIPNGTADTSWSDYMPSGYIKSFGEDGTAVYVSKY